MVRASWLTRRAVCVLFVACFSLAACTHEVVLVNVEDGRTVSGEHHVWSRSLTLVWPTGERLEGRYTALTTEEINDRSLFFGANFGSLLGRNTWERFFGYARLSGETGLVVEIVFASGWTGHGYGVARSSGGDEYRVSF